MASNLERLGGFIQDKATGAASNFAYGVKASFLSANPAGFAKLGAGIDFLKDEIRSQTQNDKEEAKKQRNEQRRSRGFNEISERNRQYQQMQEQKLFVSIDENIKKILELLKKDGEDSMFPGLLGGLLAGSTKSPKIPGAERVAKTPDGKPIKPGDLDGKRLPRATDPEFKKFRLKGLGFVDDIIKSFEKMKTSLFKTSIKFPELERYATKMSDDMGKSVKVIENMADGIKASRETLLARFGPQFGGPQGNKLLGGAALDSRLNKLAKTADTGAAAQDFVKGLSFGMPAEFAKGADAVGDVAKGADAVGDVGKGVKGLSAILGIFGSIGNQAGNMFKGLAEITDVKVFAKGLLKVAGPLGLIVSIFDGVQNAMDTEALQKQLGKQNVDTSDRFAGFIGGFVGSIGGLFDLLAEAMGITWDGMSIQEYLTTTVTKISAFGLDVILDTLKAIGAVIIGVTGMLTDNEAMKELAGTRLEYLEEKWFGPLKRWWADMQDTIGGTIQIIINNIKHGLFEIKERLVYFGEKISTTLNTYAMKFAKVVDNVIGEGKIFFAEGINDLVDTLKNVVNWVIEGINDLTSGIIDAIPDRLFGVSLKEKKASLKETVTIAEISTAESAINVEEMKKNLAESQAEYDAKIRELETKNANAEEELERRIAANRERLSEEEKAAAEAAAERSRQREIEDAENLERLRKESGLDKTPEEEAAESRRDVGDEEDIDVLNETQQETQQSVEELNQTTGEGLDNIQTSTDHQTAQDIAIAEAQAAAAEKMHKEQSELQVYLSDRLNEMLYGWMGQQSDLFQALVGPLLEGQSGGGPLGTIIDNLFGGGKGGGLGDVLGNLFGKGKGGWFDSASNWLKGTFGPIGESLSGIGDAIGSLFKTSSGTSIFSTPGFSGGSLGSIFGGGGASMDPLAALLGTKLSGSLGLTGVGANAAFDVAQSLLTPGTGMAGIKGALAGPGGFAGGLGAIMSIFGGDSTTLGGALSGGLGIYQLFRGGGLSNMLGGALQEFAGRQALASGSVVGPYSFAGAGAQTALGRFGMGMQDPSMLFSGEGGLAGRLGGAAGAIGTGFTAKAIGDFLSGGYTANKHLTTAGGLLAGIGATGALGPLLAAGPAGIVIGVVAGLANRLFGRKAKEYTDVGFDLNLGTNTTGQVYKDWIKKGGAYRSDKKGTEYENLDNDLVNYFNETAGAIQKGYGQLAEMMGMSADSIVGFTKSYSISLKGLSAAEQQKKIADAMTRYAKDAIQASYGNVAKYAIKGEDTLATFERLATSTQTVDYWFDALGYTAEKTTDIFKTFGEDMSTAGAEAAAGFLGIDWTQTGYYANFMGGGIPAAAMYGRGYAWTDGMYDMYGEFAGYGGFDFYQYMQNYAPALTAEQQANQQALGIAGAKAAFVEMFGGQEAFGSAMSSYFNLFYSAEEQAEFARKQAVQLAQDVLSGLDPEIASLIEQFGESGIQTQEQFDQALADYRAQIDAAIAAGDMELAQQLISGAELFYQAAELSMQAAEMNEEGDLISQMTPGEFFGHTIQAAQGVMGTMGTEEGIKTLTDTLETTAFTAADAETLAAETAAAVGEAVSTAGNGNQFADLIAAPSINTNQNVTNQNVNLFSDNIRDYHPILDVNIRGVTSAFIGVGSN